MTPWCAARFALTNSKTFRAPSRSPERTKPRLCLESVYLRQTRKSPFPLFAKLTILPPSQLLTLGTRQTVLAATFIATGLTPPVADRPPSPRNCLPSADNKTAIPEPAPRACALPGPTRPSGAGTPARKGNVFPASRHLLCTMVRGPRNRGQLQSVDVYSRRIVGWAMADHLRTELVLEALNMAVSQRRPDYLGSVEARVHGGDAAQVGTSGRARPRLATLPAAAVGAILPPRWTPSGGRSRIGNRLLSAVDLPVASGARSAH